LFWFPDKTKDSKVVFAEHHNRVGMCHCISCYRN